MDTGPNVTGMTSAVGSPRILTRLLTAALALTIATLTACSSSGSESVNTVPDTVVATTVTTAPTDDDDDPTAAAAEDPMNDESDDPAPEDEAEPADQAPSPPPADCAWDAPKASGGAAPSGRDGDLATALIGSWQLVATDGEPVDQDIRYVFHSDSEVLYCQDVPGITDRAENPATYQLDGDVITMNDGAATYTALDWGADTMTWSNELLGDTFLLVRR